MKPLSERIKTFSTSQFVDWLCLACVDVREVHTPYDAQEEINKIREALTERLSTLQEQLTATTNSLTNAQEALKSAGIEADTVQAGVMGLVSKLVEMQNRATESEAEAEKNLAGAHAWEKHARRATAERDALATENAALKGFFETGINASFEGCDFFGDHMQSRAMELGLVREEPYCKDQHENLVINACDFEDGDPVYFINETPATDAYLNAVRAEGVEMFANHFNCPDISDDILEFAAQLRAGNAGKDGV